MSFLFLSFDVPLFPLFPLSLFLFSLQPYLYSFIFFSLHLYQLLSLTFTPALFIISLFLFPCLGTSLSQYIYLSRTHNLQLSLSLLLCVLSLFIIKQKAAFHLIFREWKEVEIQSSERIVVPAKTGLKTRCARLIYRLV